MKRLAHEMLVFAFLLGAALVTGKPLTKSDLITYAAGWAFGTLISFYIERRITAARDRRERRRKEILAEWMN